MRDKTTLVSRICKRDDDKQIIYGEVYAPGQLDTHGEMMLAEDVETMAHRFMASTKMGENIDYMHDNVPRDCYPVESFIAREGDPDYTPGAWVLGVKVEDQGIWSRIKKGEINGYSFEALVRKVAVVVEVEYDPESVGVTEEANGHVHLFYARLDEGGRVIHGVTSQDAGHYHLITRASATEMAEGHAHRFFS